MKDQRITIPENTRVIIDGDIIIFESKEPKVLEVGKWYKHHNFLRLIVNKHLDCCGFNSKQWSGESKGNTISVNLDWQPANPKEVTRLLIGEAEKRGFKEGAKFKMCDDKVLEITRDSIEFDENWGNGGTRNCLIAECGGSLMHIWNDKYGWAEIIPEKKPLYTNSYGTEFFKGDECWAVSNFKGHKLAAKAEYYINNGSHAKSIAASELMTEREYHRYLADNWDELNKNK